MRLAGAPRQGEPDWRKVRLLVLDRDDQFRFWIRTVFGRVHVLSIITAATPREAVEQMVGAFPTVALIELYHQDTVGIDFLRNLRNRRISPIPELPVIMVARTHDKVHLARASSLGVETVLVPPVAEIAVLAAVTQAVMAPRHVTPRVALERPRRSVLPDPVVLTAEPARVQAVKAPVKPRERAEAPSPAPKAPPPPQPAAKRPTATVPPLRSAPAPAAPKPPPKPPVAPVAATPAPAPAAQPKPMLRVPMEAPPRADAKPGPELMNRMRAHEVWLRSHGAQGTKADFAGANFTGQNLTGVNFMQVDLREAKLVNADLTDASLTGADLRDADLSGARLIGANLGVARLRHARMRVGDLDGANLRGADLSGANLTGAHFGQADLTGAVFLETIINDADLSEVAGLTQKQLQRAWGNARTLLPSGLTVVERPS